MWESTPSTAVLLRLGNREQSLGHLKHLESAGLGPRKESCMGKEGTEVCPGVPKESMAGLEYRLKPYAINQKWWLQG